MPWVAESSAPRAGRFPASSIEVEILKRYALVLSMCLLACASTSGAGSQVRDLDPTNAEECRYLGDVTESQYSGMLFAGQGLEQARVKVRDSAADLGATHVVWSSMAAGGAVQAASAKAYVCPEPPTS